MALEACRECGKEISTQAHACPHCGFLMGGTPDEKLTTTQLTSKRIKIHDLCAGVIFSLGGTILIWGWVWSYGIGIFLGGLLTVVGLLYGLWVHVMKWWHHH